MTKDQGPKTTDQRPHMQLMNVFVCSQYLNSLTEHIIIQSAEAPCWKHNQNNPCIDNQETKTWAHRTPKAHELRRETKSRQPHQQKTECRKAKCPSQLRQNQELDDGHEKCDEKVNGGHGSKSQVLKASCRMQSELLEPTTTTHMSEATSTHKSTRGKQAMRVE